MNYKDLAKISRRRLLGNAGFTVAGFAASNILRQAGGAETGPIDIDSLFDTGIYSTTLRHAVPDEHGIHFQRTLLLDSFPSGVGYTSQWWPAGGNRVYPKVIRRPADVPEGTLFLLIQRKSGKYLALLPMADEEVYAWFSGDGKHLSVKLGTLGRETVSGEKSLFAWSAADTAYAAIAQAWRTGLGAINPQTVLLREEKSYPKMFKYLGWCSWESFGSNINEQNVTDAVRQIEESNVPIRYFLMDEGHADNQTLRADPAKFPHGYKSLTKYKNVDKIKWFGLWWAFLGAAHGVKAPGRLGPLADAMMTTGNDVLIPKPDKGSATRFFDHILSETNNGGFDFVKIDFMVDALPLYAGVKEDVPTLGGLPANNENAIRNPFAAAAMLTRICEENVAEKSHGMMNCNWHNTACLLNSGSSAVGRCSEDYKSNELDRAKAHIYHAFSSIPWLGQTMWGDHDMFHSTDRVAAFPMAVSKAISGGPIYLSDEPGTFAKDVIEPLCFQDGRLLRPIAPGAPVEEDIFYAPDSGKLFRVVAPLPNESVAVAIFNLEGADNRERYLSTKVTSDHYRLASGMMQSYPGAWEMPQEGLVVYEWDKKQAIALGGQFEVHVPEFGVSLLQISPIRSGWSVVGRTDKYLPAAAISAIEYSQDHISFRVEEAGPFAVWSSRATPYFMDKALTAIGDGLFLADIPVSVEELDVVLRR